MLLAVGEDPPRQIRRAALARLGEQLTLSGVFVLLALRYWLTVFPLAAREIRRLRAAALGISDPTHRRVALAALSKRSNIEGATAFAALLPRAPRANALRALVAFQSIYNYADALAEETSAECRSSATRAHAAMLLALSARANPPLAEPGELATPDGPYLLEQVLRCRHALAGLPSVDLVIARALIAATEIWAFQTHSSVGPDRFESWARSRPQAPGTINWWESAGAAGSSLSVHALIAAAGVRSLDPHTVERLEAAYGGPIGALHSLLDSLIDESEDARIAQASLISFYPSRPAAAEAMGHLAARSMLAARSLPHARAHAVLLASMMSLYTSDPQAREPRAAPIARAVRVAVGPTAGPADAVFALRRLLARATRPCPGERRAEQETVETPQPAPSRADAA